MILFFKEVVSQNTGQYHMLSSKPTKKLIDSTAYIKWPFVENAVISNDGKYMKYVLRNESQIGYTAILKESKGNWGVKIPNAFDVRFTSDSKMAVCLSRDTLFILALGGTSIERVPDVDSYQLSSSQAGQYIAYHSSKSKVLVLRNLVSGKVLSWEFIDNYEFSKNERSLIFESRINEKSGVTQVLNRIEISSMKLINIWKGNGLSAKTMNSSASQFIFILQENEVGPKSAWYYKDGFRKPVLLLGNFPVETDSTLVLDYISHISNNGRYIFFTLRKMLRESGLVDRRRGSTVNVWSYLDEKIQSAQMDDDESNISYSAVLDLVNRNVTILSTDKERVLNKSINEDVFLIWHKSGNGDILDWKWNSSARQTHCIKSLVDSTSITLKMKGETFVDLSPDGKFVVFYDKELRGYFSYEISSKVYRSITSGIDVSWLDYYRDNFFKDPRGIVGWLSNTSYVLIYDRFDIWKVDLLCKHAPVNITNGYGLKNNIMFSIGLPGSYPFIYTEKDTVLLNAINVVDKQNGFFRKAISRSGDPEKLTMDDCIYQLVNNHHVHNAGAYPVKARDCNKYIVLKMKADESPNYYFTDDFKTFIPESSVYPERAYNWYKTELHSFKEGDNKVMQGVLYKPEDFNPNHKYPVILHYYDKKSFSLNEYLVPQNIAGTCNIDIPTFVSNGYLVFTPDIDFIVGDPMKGTYDAVVSAANYLSNLPYIDRTKMGIGGCSLGGIETNYLVSHTNLFAAAYSSSSMSDLVSAYNDVPEGTRSLHFLFESGQLRMGGTLWQIPEKYIRNSAIFNADRVTTPLLLMHTTRDGICSFSQALEFFTALRRLGKKVWLLEYSDGMHGVRGVSAVDFGIRLSQFFDHYLKDKPAPQWMTRGVPAKMKGVDNGYKLDSAIRTPGVGLVADSSKISSNK